MHRFLLPFIVLGLLLALPVSAFFGDLDALEQELEGGATEQEGGSLDTLIEQLEGLQETPSQTSAFTDVASSAWYFSAVNAVAEWGIVSGYKDAGGRPTGTFGPGNPVTIAEMLKMAYAAAGVDTNLCRTVVDHPQAQTHWAKAYVACAEQQNMRVLRSQPDLNRGAKRGEVVAIIHDAFGDDVPASISSPFRDTVGHTYERDISYAAMFDVVSGDKVNGQPTGYYRPDDGVNRAEAAKILHQKLLLSAQ